jgi:hypothetical protein
MGKEKQEPGIEVNGQSERALAVPEATPGIADQSLVRFYTKSAASSLSHVKHPKRDKRDGQKPTGVWLDGGWICGFVFCIPLLAQVMQIKTVPQNELQSRPTWAEGIPNRWDLYLNSRPSVFPTRSW